MNFLYISVQSHLGAVPELEHLNITISTIITIMVNKADSSEVNPDWFYVAQLCFLQSKA